MNNDELKKKICKIIADNYLPKEMPERLEDYKLYRFSRAADALIAAGIGDVKEAEHRAEVAERALREFAVQCGCDKCPFLGRCNISPDVEGDYQGCFNMYLSIAEKELAEERKDD